MALLDREAELRQDFLTLTNWEDRYKKIIALGKALPELPENLKTEEAKVKGCQSQVWLHAKVNDQGLIDFQGDSDALLVRGLVAMMLKVYSSSTPEEILKNPPLFLKELGFESHLSPSRANGLHAMAKQIRHFATAFLVLSQRKSDR